MSDCVEPSWFHRVNSTPLGDLLRGRLTGRLDWRGTIAAAAVPPQAKDLIRRVVGKTGLWRSEKADVTEELLAHFLDGMESGLAIEKLIRDFGDAKQAARLIGRAKKRCRPMILRATVWLAKALAVLVVIHLLLVARFCLGHSSPAVDYVNVVNKPILRVPPDQRGWPLYRQAILDTADFKPPEELPLNPENLEPGGKDWPWMADWLHRHAAALDLIRRGAGRPALGFVFGRGGSIDDPAVFPEAVPYCKSTEEQPLSALWRGDLNNLNRFTFNFLAADAELARQENDSARVVADINAMLDIARQLGAVHGGIMDGSILIGIRRTTLEEIESTLLEKPALLSDTDIASLAHRLAGFASAGDYFHPTYQRLVVIV